METTVTRNLVDELYDLRRRFETGNDGYRDLSSYEDWRSAFGMSQELFAHLDADADGKVPWKEFVDMMSRVPNRALQLRQLLEQYAVVDVFARHLEAHASQVGGDPCGGSRRPEQSKGLRVPWRRLLGPGRRSHEGNCLCCGLSAH